MRWGYLAAAAGLEIEGAAINEEKVHQQLVEQAILFLRGGGHATLAEWGAMSTGEREALAAAGDRLAEVKAALIGVACQGPQQAAALAQGMDAEDLTVHLALAAAVGRLAKQQEAHGE